MIKRNNFYVIQYYMIKDLKLKGLELQLYAIINGFSQTKDNYYTAPLSYMVEFTGATRQAITTAIKKLIDKELLIKEENIINNVNLPKYKVNDLKNISWLNEELEEQEKTTNYNTDLQEDVRELKQLLSEL